MIHAIPGWGCGAGPFVRLGCKSAHRLATLRLLGAAGHLCADVHPRSREGLSPSVETKETTNLCRSPAARARAYVPPAAAAITSDGEAGSSPRREHARDGLQEEGAGAAHRDDAAGASPAYRPAARGRRARRGGGRRGRRGHGGGGRGAEVRPADRLCVRAAVDVAQPRQLDPDLAGRLQAGRARQRAATHRARGPAIRLACAAQDSVRRLRARHRRVRARRHGAGDARVGARQALPAVVRARPVQRAGQGVARRGRARGALWPPPRSLRRRRRRRRVRGAAGAAVRGDGAAGVAEHVWHDVRRDAGAGGAGRARLRRGGRPLLPLVRLEDDRRHVPNGPRHGRSSTRRDGARRGTRRDRWEQRGQRGWRRATGARERDARLAAAAAAAAAARLGGRAGLHRRQAGLAARGARGAGSAALVRGARVARRLRGADGAGRGGCALGCAAAAWADDRRRHQLRSDRSGAGAQGDGGGRRRVLGRRRARARAAAGASAAWR